MNRKSNAWVSLIALLLLAAIIAVVCGNRTDIPLTCEDVTPSGYAIAYRQLGWNGPTRWIKNRAATKRGSD